MTEGRYGDIANLAWEDIPEPKLVPTGTWKLEGRNAVYLPKKEGDAESKAKVLFFYNAYEAMGDVRDEDLDALGDYNLENSDLSAMFYIERETDWDKVKKHLALHGVEPKGSIPETLKKFKHTKVLGFVDQQTYKSRQTGKMVTGNTLSEFAALD